MHPTTDPINQAIELFLGFGEAPSPQHDRARLMREFGEVQGAVLESQVLAILQEVAKIPIDWSKHTLVSAKTQVLAEMRTRYPELSDGALRALGWDFTFAWR